MVTASAPDVAEVDHVSAIASPVIRNLRITYCYSRLAAAVADRCGTGANWCTFATWASRQAGRTIRGEDLSPTSTATSRGAQTCCTRSKGSGALSFGAASFNRRRDSAG